MGESGKGKHMGVRGPRAKTQERVSHLFVIFVPLASHVWEEGAKMC